MLKLKGLSVFPCLLVGVGLWVVTSCSDNNFLDQTQTTDLNQETVFADSTYTSGFLNQIYSDVGFDTDPARFTYIFDTHGGLQTACDEAEFKKSSSVSADAMFATGTVNPVTITDDAWNKCYQDIRRVNVFLKYIDGCPMAENAKTTYKAEARFLRAWYYFILLRHYGGVPLIGDHVYNAADSIKTKRDNFSDCVDYIVNECQIAGKDLPARRTGRDNGRIGDGVCKALISRLRLYAASPLYNGSSFAPSAEYQSLLGYPQYDKERWKLAVDAARDVISLNRYRLFEMHVDDNGNPEPGWGFYALFKAKDFYQYTNVDGETYEEGAYSGTILEQKKGDGLDLERNFDPPTCGGTDNGGYIYEELAESFPMLDGKAIGTSDKYPYDPLHPNVGRDPRFANTVIYDGCAVTSGNDYTHKVYTSKGVGSTTDAIYAGTPTGYYIRKMIHRKAAANYWVEPPQSRPLIRYSEILLNYAEAVNEYYGPDYTESLGGQVMSPYVALKAIRKRGGIEAGSDGMYGLKANMTQDEMREAIRSERRIELALEGHRFFDVRRWMIAEDTDNKLMHGMEITNQNDGSKTYNIVGVRTHVFRKAMYFWPIPYSEVVKSKDMLQNPYYDK